MDNRAYVEVCINFLRMSYGTVGGFLCVANMKNPLFRPVACEPWRWFSWQQNIWN